MRPPAASAKVNFHISGHRWRVTNLNDRPAKIRSALEAAESRMKHANGLPVQRLELRTLQALMLPDGLEQSLRRQIGRVPEAGHRSMAPAPLRVEAGGDEDHLGLLLRWRFRKVKRRNE